jgi:hypothetical protein
LVVDDAEEPDRGMDYAEGFEPQITQIPQMDIKEIRSSVPSE